jgi:hypothetical protein
MRCYMLHIHVNNCIATLSGNAQRYTQQVLTCNLPRQGRGPRVVILCQIISSDDSYGSGLNFAELSAGSPLSERLFCSNVLRKYGHYRIISFHCTNFSTKTS